MKIFLTCPNCDESDFERIEGDVKFRCKNCGTKWLTEDMIGEAEDAKEDKDDYETHVEGQPERIQEECEDDNHRNGQF